MWRRALILAAAGWVGLTAGAGEWAIDLGRTNGVFRALHGVNGGPLCYRGVVDLTPRHRELGIPFTRLHDTVWVNADAVDIHTLFPDFRDDPGDPASYDFRVTDDVVQAVVNSGAQVVYRLGESIEHTVRKHWVHPPADPVRWAEICEGVIRHYNEGWADGFRHGIRYWEIWNEPDVRPAMWTGSDEAFLRLFEVTAKRLKRRFPDLKIGGPAVGGTGDFVGGEFRPAPFVKRFLTFCQERQVPLDFFSWHRYTADPRDLARRAVAIREVLDGHGFRAAESHLNEWNFLPDDDWGPMLKGGSNGARERWYGRMNGAEGAAFVVGSLLLLQDAPVDVANYFSGEIQGFGLFDFHGEPKRTFHGFRAFRRLLDTPIRLAVTGDLGEGQAIAAGKNAAGTEVGVVLACWRTGDERVRLSLRNRAWQGPVRWEAEGTIGAADATVLGAGRAEGDPVVVDFRLPGPGVARLRLWKSD